jgi:hypothetical protein
MQSLPNKRWKIPETWVAAFLFPFKLHCVIGVVWLGAWYWMLPAAHWGVRSSRGDLWYAAASDFALVGHYVIIFYFLAAAVLWVGGLIQLFAYARTAGFWSMGFGIFAFAAGMALVIYVAQVNDGLRQYRSQYNLGANGPAGTTSLPIRLAERDRSYEQAWREVHQQLMKTGSVLNCSWERGLPPASTHLCKATLMRPKGRAPQIKTLPGDVVACLGGAK